MARRRCECGAKLGYYRRQKDEKVKWVPFKKDPHGQCPRCWRASQASILTRKLRGRKEPEIPEVP